MGRRGTPNKAHPPRIRIKIEPERERSAFRIVGLVGKRGSSKFRRGDKGSADTDGKSPAESRNGGSPEANGARDDFTQPMEQQADPSDREADTDEFTIPHLVRAPEKTDAEDLKPEDASPSQPAATPVAPPGRKPDEKKRSGAYEWYVDDGSGEPPETFLPADEPATGEKSEPKHSVAAKPAARPSAKPPRTPAAPRTPADPPAPDIGKRIRMAERAAERAAELRAINEINALDEDLERAKRESAARALALEARLAEAERRAAEAEAEAAASAKAAPLADPGRARELEEEARTGAASWLREQLREVEGARQAEAAQADAELAAAERRLREEADQRVKAETADLRHEVESLRASLDERVDEAEERAREDTAEVAPPAWVMKPPVSSTGSPASPRPS